MCDRLCMCIYSTNKFMLLNHKLQDVDMSIIMEHKTVPQQKGKKQFHKYFHHCSNTTTVYSKERRCILQYVNTSLMMSQNKIKYEIKLLYKAGSSPAINWRSIQVDKSSTTYPTYPPITL